MSRSIHDEEHYEEPSADEAIASFTKKTKTIVLAAVVAVAAIGGVLVLYTVDEGSVQSVELTGPSRSDDLLTFAYTIRTDRAAASGPTDFAVKLNGTAVFSRSFAAGAGGGGRIDVHLADFVVGNGDYSFVLTYKDKSTTVHYVIGTPDKTNFIVTEMGVLPAAPGDDEPSPVNLIFVGDGHEGAIGFSVYFFSDRAGRVQTQAPPGSMLDMRVLKNGQAVSDIPDLNVSVEGKSFYQHNFTVAPRGPGNYSIAATFTNQWVKDDSPIKTLTMTNTTFIQSKPYACVKNSPYHGNQANNYTITADASCSHDDIRITQYTWTFGDGTNPVTNGDIPMETHAYPSSFPVKSYTGTVCADDGMSPEDPLLTCTSFQVTTSQN